MVDDVSPTQAWRALVEDPRAWLVDVRSDAEWLFVGLPELGEAGKQPLLIPWQVFPSMQVNPGFVAAVRAAGPAPDDHLYFLCRSGQRSAAAAGAMAQAGFAHVYNVAGGFEGPPDADGHRGTVAGWKAEGLPWRQR
jgi:rhodanese-related sulfurtransferase